MSLPLIWLLVAILAAIVELTLPLFGFIIASVAAFLAAAAAALGFSLTTQFVVFGFALLVSLTLVRPRFVTRRSPGVPSRTEALIGRSARVTVGIDPTTGSGRVLVAGEDWAASSSSQLPPGAAVQVTGAEGIVLQVALENLASGSTAP